MRLRSKILLAMLSMLLAGDLLAVWIVQDRLQIGVEHEAANQARARALHVQAVYAERAVTPQAESEAISLHSRGDQRTRREEPRSAPPLVGTGCALAG